MARSAKTTKTDHAAITRGTGNVFADLGYDDADERQTKLRLAFAINEVIGRQRLAGAAAAEKLGISRPKVSALANYKLDDFSVEQLIALLAALRQDAKFVIRKSSRRARREHSVDPLLDQRLFVFDADDYDAFVRALDNPPAPGPKLRSLPRRVPAWRK
jgi:predicted XRE-type DNA-binding protein